MASYLPYEPQQQMLPEAPEGHLAYFISDTVDGLDLEAFHARYASGGPRNQPFHPAMMVKVLVGHKRLETTALYSCTRMWQPKCCAA